MELSMSIENHNFILKLKGEFDGTACTKLNDALEAGARSFCRNIILDLAELKYITSTGQRILLSYLTRLQSLNMKLILCQLKPDIDYALKESGLQKLLTITPTLREAKAQATR